VVDRAWNFSPGPGALPLPVLERVREELLEYPGTGASILEISHRSPAFERVIEEADANLRDLLRIPATHRVLFLQGGASLQFSMVPMNLLLGSAGYVLTGSWGKKAHAEAIHRGDARTVWDGAETGYTSVPRSLDSLADGLDYLHVTSNETIEGVEFPPGFEPTDGPPLVCDASSDLLSRPIPVELYGLLYAGAQKNAGPAGLTIVVLREDLLERIPRGVPTMLDYRWYVEHRSLYNTPPVFAIYVLMLVTRWLRDEIGGLDAMAERNREKASLLYDEIDGSNGFYRRARRRDRPLADERHVPPARRGDGEGVRGAGGGRGDSRAGRPPERGRDPRLDLQGGTAGGGANAPVVHGALPGGYPLTMQVSVRLSPGSSWMSLNI
jgi:phosphoserine aminotransferase